jgi:hypothetical protein
MADTYDPDKKSNMANTMAMIAIIIAVIGLIWAIKADKRAGDALHNSKTVSSKTISSGSTVSSATKTTPKPVTTHSSSR